MNKLTEQEALTYINDATGKNYASFDAIQKDLTPPAAAPIPSTGNEKLADLVNKITKMVIVDTVQTSELEKWDKFVHNTENLEIGALIEIIDTGLLTPEDDVIQSNTDLLPNLSAIPSQYIQRLTRNVKKRIELVISESIYKRAFTNINAFNSFLSVIVKRVRDTFLFDMYKLNLNQTGISFKNLHDFGAQADILEFFKAIYTDISKYVPYSTQMNLGAVEGDTTIPLAVAGSNVGVDNATGPAPVKTNTLTRTGTDGTYKFDDLLILCTSTLEADFTNKLADTYHSNFLSIAAKFGGVIPIPQAELLNVQKAMGVVANDATEPVENFAVVVDKRAFYCFWNLKVDKNQFWAKGEGDGLRQMVFTYWANLGYVPWVNGKAYYGTITPPAAPPAPAPLINVTPAPAPAPAPAPVVKKTPKKG